MGRAWNDRTHFQSFRVTQNFSSQVDNGSQAGELHGRCGRDESEDAGALPAHVGWHFRGVESGIVYRLLAERPYIDPGVLKAAWEAPPPPWQDGDAD